MKRIAIVLAVLAGGCTAAPSVTARSKHIDLAGGDGELLREAEAAFELLAEALELRPSRVTLVMVADQAAFDRVAGAAAGAQGVYRAGRILTFRQPDARVLRHELAHHFAVALVGDLSPALNEGIAEVLEGITRVNGRAYVPVVSPEHLDRLLETGTIAIRATAEHRHVHVDYAGAWALVAFALERGTGTLRERLLALKPDVEPPTVGELLGAAKRWRPELGRQLVEGSLEVRAAAARVLGRLGNVEALEAAWDDERYPRVRLNIAGALARNGDPRRLRAMLREMDCDHARAEALRAAGQ